MSLRAHRARAQALGLKMRIAAKGKEETDSKAASCKPGDGDMQLEEITGDVETEGSGQEGSGREGSGRDQGSGPTLTSVATRTSATDGPAQCEAHTKVGGLPNPNPNPDPDPKPKPKL